MKNIGKLLAILLAVLFVLGTFACNPDPIPAVARLVATPPEAAFGYEVEVKRCLV